MTNRQRVEFDYYITPDGERFGLNNGTNKFLLSFTGLGMPPIDYIAQRGPNQHGVTIVTYRLQQRLIQYVYAQNGNTRSEYWDNRAALLDIFRPNRETLTQLRGTLRKVLPGGKVRDIDVVIAEGPVFNARRLDVWEEGDITEVLRFLADDPTFYDPTLNTVTWTLDPEDSNLTFPITFPITFGYSLIIDSNVINYTGTWFSFPTITITGPIAGFKITNTSTGEFIHLERSVEPGEVIVITLEYGNKTVTSSVYGNVIGDISLDSDLATFNIAPHPIAPNGVNTFELFGTSADEDTEVLLEYYTRYIGI